MGFFADCPVAALVPLAARLRPVTAMPGQVLMCQGERPETFLLIASGRVQVSHTGTDGQPVTVDADPGLIVGEIAMLRDAPRTATVTALQPLTGWAGDPDAFALMVELPGVMAKLVRIARQRLAAFITPIPVRMRDGTRLHLRPVLPGDNERTATGPVEFSSETLYRRFQSGQALNSSLMSYLFEVDYVDHFVWVLTEGADGPVVADARFVRDTNDPTIAEVAFLVADSYQGRGVGSFLMSALAVAAASDGVRQFTARVLAENDPMRRILDKLGASWHRDDLNVVTSAVHVPRLRELDISPRLYRQIHDVTRQVMWATG